MTTEKPVSPAAHYAIGDVVRVPFDTYSATIEVDCVLLDTRRAYGRTDYLVAPVKGGDTPTWVTENTVLKALEKESNGQ